MRAHWARISPGGERASTTIAVAVRVAVRTAAAGRRAGVASAHTPDGDPSSPGAISRRHARRHLAAQVPERLPPATHRAPRASSRRANAEPVVAGADRVESHRSGGRGGQMEPRSGLEPGRRDHLHLHGRAPATEHAIHRLAAERTVTQHSRGQRGGLKWAHVTSSHGDLALLKACRVS